VGKDIKEFANPQYLKMLPDYQLIRDCFDGSRAVKEAGVKYLPKLKGQSQDDYDNYLTRALFFPITGKTCTTMVGMATTKPPKAVYPAELEDYFVDTNASYQFTEFYVRTLTEVTLMGRWGVLIDGPANASGEPRLCPYSAENIMRWIVDRDGRPIDLLLREMHLVSGEQEFELKMVTIYRRCVVANGVYTVMEYDEDLKPSKPPVTPLFSGRTIDYVPFVCMGSTGVHMEPDRPPMLDIATINHSHYLTSADLEWGRHITGLPTPVVSGVDSSTKLSIGGTSAWVLPTPEAKAYYMEFLGQGLQSLEKGMADKISLMASVSARMVDTSTRGSEAAETVKLRYMSETASLVHIINSVEGGLTMLYNMLAKLKLSTGEIKLTFSKEIIGAGITFKDLAAMFEAFYKRMISKETLIYNLRRVDAIDPNRSDEDEMAAIPDPPEPKPPTIPTGA
jgi:hypothetical protein